jgi:flagellar basal body-associated protein FliL
MHVCGNARARRLRAAGSALLWTVFAATAPAAHAADAPAVHKTTQSESYIAVDPIYSTILDGGRPRGLLLVEFGLDVPDETLRDRATGALPVLRDAYVRSLASYAAIAVRPWRQPSVEDIANRIQIITDHLLGQKGARVLMAQTAIRITH